MSKLKFKVQYKELKLSLEVCDFLITDYVAPFKTYVPSSNQDPDMLKSTRSIEKHEFTNFTKSSNMMGKRPTMKKSISPIYSKRASEFLLKLINQDYKSPKKTEKADSPVKKVNFELNLVDTIQKPASKYSSIYTNRLSNFIKNDFLLKVQESDIEEKTESDSKQRTEDLIEQEILIIEPANKKPEPSKIIEPTEGKFLEVNEKSELILDLASPGLGNLSESDSSSSEDEEQSSFKNGSKLPHSKTETTKGFLLSSLLKEEKTSGVSPKRKKTYAGSPKHFRLKPKKKTMITSEMNIILQKEAWLHQTGSYI